jgi:phage protein U
MSALVAVGAAVLRTIGLNPQRIGDESEGRAPGKATFAGMDYQLTGMGDHATRLEFATWPQVIGGMDALAILQLQHRTQAVVPYIRLGANWLGTLQGFVVVRHLATDEERLHPFTGVGRIVHGEAELLHVGSGAGGVTFGIQ